MNNKAVLFDLDGTILYTLPDLKSALNYALSMNGYPERTLDEVRRFIGNGLRKLVERSLPADSDPDLISEVLGDLKNYYSVHMADETVPYPGITDMLISLKEKGVKIGVVTNKVDSAANGLMPIYFDGLIDFCIGERDDMPRKPAPQPVMAALEKLDVHPMDTIYVGDSDVDVYTALNSGCGSIVVTWGYRSREELAAAGATLFAEDPAHLLSLIEKELEL